jgi:hypothetical protein
MNNMARTVFLAAALCALPCAAVASQPSAGYHARVKGNSVTICPQLLNDRACPQAEGMLRQSVETGEVVRLAQQCTRQRVGSAAHHGACYLDECVPPGRYRYGYARPLECVGGMTLYYTEVTVTRHVPEFCRRTSTPPTPRTHVPWGPSPYVCVSGWTGQLARYPELTWGLLLLLVVGVSFVLLLHHGKERS